LLKRFPGTRTKSRRLPDSRRCDHSKPPSDPLRCAIHGAVFALSRRESVPINRTNLLQSAAALPAPPAVTLTGDATTRHLTPEVERKFGQAIERHPAAWRTYDGTRERLGRA
jgi:hypothetical protein